MAKKISFESFLVTAINAQTNEQATTTKNFVTALVNAKTATTTTAKDTKAKSTRGSKNTAAPAAATETAEAAAA
jgi:hypothetical protein